MGVSHQGDGYHKTRDKWPNSVLLYTLRVISLTPGEILLSILLVAISDSYFGKYS